MNILVHVDINRPWVLCTDREGGKTLAKQRHWYQNKVNHVPNRTGQLNHYSKAEIAKDFLSLYEHKNKQVPTSDTASTKDSLYRAIRQLHISQ
jgi:hypothetical protein